MAVTLLTSRSTWWRHIIDGPRDRAELGRVDHVVDPGEPSGHDLHAGHADQRVPAEQQDARHTGHRDHPQFDPEVEPAQPDQQRGTRATPRTGSGGAGTASPPSVRYHLGIQQRDRSASSPRRAASRKAASTRRCSAASTRRRG
jgi:hypothetical protein